VLPATLPDLLADGVHLILVGINPSTYSVVQGHYFARPQNRFWPAFSQSGLSLPMRQALGVTALRPEHDRRLPEFGIGLTDLVKKHSPNAATLTPADYRSGAAGLSERLSRYHPRCLAFHGMTAFRPFVRYALGRPDVGLVLGPQPFALDGVPLFVLPNPSPANAAYRLEHLVGWYDTLEGFLSGGLNDSPT
jgi:TDG/mug DNA glycosylase family protein